MPRLGARRVAPRGPPSAPCARTASLSHVQNPPGRTERTAECSLRPGMPFWGLPIRAGCDMSCTVPDLCRAHSFCTQRTETFMDSAIWAFVMSPFCFWRTIHCTPDLFRFMLLGRARLTYLPALLRQTHTPLFPVACMRPVHLILTDFTPSEKG